MHLGLFGINVGAHADPQTAIQVARAAEAAGLESLWTGEHVVLPDPQMAPSPVAPETPFLDPAVALTLVAGVTTTIRLGTGIIILPQRNPVVLAKEMASVDVVSNGRLIFGVGVGYLKSEFDAVGASFENKGARTIDYLAAMRALWTMDKPEYNGRFVRFAGVQAFPRPLQKPHPPIVMGGHTPAAFRRAVRSANGWYGFGLSLDAAKAAIDGLRAVLAEQTRPAELGPLEISITPAGKLDRDTIGAWRDLGVQRLIVSRWSTDAKQALAAVDYIARLNP